jgi:hypothetical protein
MHILGLSVCLPDCSNIVRATFDTRQLKAQTIETLIQQAKVESAKKAHKNSQWGYNLHAPTSTIASPVATIRFLPGKRMH